MLVLHICHEDAAELLSIRDAIELGGPLGRQLQNSLSQSGHVLFVQDDDSWIARRTPLAEHGHSWLKRSKFLDDLVAASRAASNGDEHSGLRCDL